VHNNWKQNRVAQDRSIGELLWTIQWNFGFHKRRETLKRWVTTSSSRTFVYGVTQTASYILIRSRNTMLLITSGFLCFICFLFFFLRRAHNNSQLPISRATSINFPCSHATYRISVSYCPPILESILSLKCPAQNFATWLHLRRRSGVLALSFILICSFPENRQLLHNMWHRICN
jgi:hypothetical protein